MYYIQFNFTEIFKYPRDRLRPRNSESFTSLGYVQHAQQVTTRVETGTLGYIRAHTPSCFTSSRSSRRFLEVCTHTHTYKRHRIPTRSSAICYCSAWASILETSPTPHPLSRPLQILTTRRRNWRDISNLESFRICSRDSSSSLLEFHKRGWD